MRLTILSRASDLARLQALLVGRALNTQFPDLDLVYLTRSSAGDRDETTPLVAMAEKGAFTSDLSEALASGAADCVVHSWKDLPLEGRSGTVIAATLERADARDLLLVRHDVIASKPATLHVLSSSPRRAWLLQTTLPALLPWRPDEIRFAPVRGNIQTRLNRLIEGRGDALVVAKAALDRLLGFGEPFEATAREIRAALDQCRFMVLPLREVPGAPAQGAVAVEVAESNQAARKLFEAICHRSTFDAVEAERRVLARHGGGCHEAVGATVVPRAYGRVVSVKAKTAVGGSQDIWAIETDEATSTRVPVANIFPRPDERTQAVRRSLNVPTPARVDGFWVARAEALPQSWRVPADQFIWAAGVRSWRKLAARGIWVNGCADGLGDVESPAIDTIAGRNVRWLRLTHAAAATADAGALATYEVEDSLPDDLPSRTHFFWMSGHLFTAALTRWPELATRTHASGPGRTWQTLSAALPAGSPPRVWADYDQWLKEIVE